MASRTAAQEAGEPRDVYELRRHMFDYATNDIHRAKEATERFAEKVQAHLFPEDRDDSSSSDSDSDADNSSDSETDTPFEKLHDALQKKLNGITERALDWVEAYIEGSWERLRLTEEQKRTLLKESRMACECITSTCSRILNSVAAVLEEISEGIEGAMTWFVSKFQGFVRNAASMLLFIFYGGKPYQPHQPAACSSPGTAFTKTPMLYKFRGREESRVKELGASQAPRVDQELQMEKGPQMPEAMPVAETMPVTEEPPVPKERPVPRKWPVLKRTPLPEKYLGPGISGCTCSSNVQCFRLRQQLKDQNLPHFCVVVLNLVLTFLTLLAFLLYTMLPRSRADQCISKE